MKHTTWIAALLLAAGGCATDGADGHDGTDGTDGLDGTDGTTGTNGVDGEDGTDGTDGTAGGACRAAPMGDGDIEGVSSAAPLSSMVALSFCDAAGTGATNVPDYVKELVRRYNLGALGTTQFPLGIAATDSLRAIEGLVPDTVARWFDPLSWSASTSAPRFGANADFIGYFGDGWQTDGSPIYAGSDHSAWVWVSHEYVSNNKPGVAAPTGQHRTLARFLGDWGVLDPALATTGSWDTGSQSVYIDEWKRQLGGTWMHIVQDPATGEWQIDRSVPAARYDATDATLTRVTGQSVSADHDDVGTPLPAGVVVGIQGDCSGDVTPWGTIINGEENVDVGYGDLEPVWSSDQKFTATAGSNPTWTPGNTITFPTVASATSDFGANPDPNAVHPRDVYGYLVELDPGQPAGEYFGKTTAGVGHQKLGAIGRARWENATVAVGSDWNLVPNQPIVVYGGQDRRGGHIYKFVTTGNYTAGMTKAQVRALLSTGKLYVAQLTGLDTATGKTMVGTNAVPSRTARGAGQWIELSLTSTAIAPNAAGLGETGRTVGQALADNDYNRIGAFATDDDVRRALFTASLKVGIKELNRPEDLEWNPNDPSGTPRLYVAFTNHNRKVALDNSGALFDPATHGTTSPTRADTTGEIWAIEETSPATPATSTTFSFFSVWQGTQGTGVFDAAAPDNIVIDADGGLWFGTDGNFGVNGHSDALYYLDLDPTHSSTSHPSFGKAFRIAAVPSDAEATGPAFSSGMGTLFFSVQHPGEDSVSSWPPR